jgi:antitoxin component of MazEF toxin-antitoxin module
MAARVRKSGSSLVLTTPRSAKRREAESSVVTPIDAPSYQLKELLAGVRRSNLHKETDWGSPVGKEVW